MRTSPVSPQHGRALALACACFVVGCQTVSAPPSTPGGPGRPAVASPDLGFFSKIKVPNDREAVLKLTARGAQVFRCEKRDTQGVWIFRQPDGELLDGAGKVVGRHRLLSTIAAHDDAPKPTDLRWLLMTTKSFGKGAFEGVTHVQRVNTSGGMPPATCDVAHAGRVLRIDFTADFVFYRARAAAAQ